MKIIFLDIDGVISPNNWPPPGAPKPPSLTHPDMLSPVCMAHLNEIIARTGARCVVSSTWRTAMFWTVLQKVFDKAGFDGLLIGQTVDLRGSRIRGREIELWVNAHQDEIDSFVILDDRDDMTPYLDRLVPTDEEVGLTAEDVEKAVRRLNEKD